MTIKTIKPSGGDFTTLSAWEASLAATLTVPQQADVYKFSGGLVEANGVVFTGLVTTATNKVVINVPSSERHTGVAHTGAYVTNGAGSAFDTLRWSNCDYWEINWFEVEALAGRGPIAVGGVTATNNFGLAQHTIIHTDTGNIIGGLWPTGKYALRNVLAYSAGTTRLLDARSVTAFEVSNCVLWSAGTDYNFLGDSASVIKNSYSGGATTACWQTGAGITGNNNASSDTTATTNFTSSLASKAGSTVFTSVTAGSEDFSLKTGANVLVDAGTATALPNVPDDIIGTTRPQGSACDIGAFERVVSSGITASAAWTETQDAWAGSVTLTFPTITANAAWTESRDLWAVTGSVKIDGAAAWTEARDVWVGSATISAAGIAATGAWIETQDLWNGSATISLPAITANGAWVERQDIWNGNGGPPQILLGDAGDPGLRKRLKKIEQQRQKDFEREREQRERRKREVIAAFDRAIEGKPQISQAVAEDIVAAIEAEEGASPTFDFEAALNNVNRLQKLWDEHIERDDEEVLALL